MSATDGKTSYADHEIVLRFFALIPNLGASSNDLRDAFPFNCDPCLHVLRSTGRIESTEDLTRHRITSKGLDYVLEHLGRDSEGRVDIAEYASKAIAQRRRTNPPPLETI